MNPNLPPGVTNAMIDRAYGRSEEEDCWDDTGFDWQPCTECGRAADEEHEIECPVIWTGNWQWMG